MTDIETLKKEILEVATNLQELTAPLDAGDEWKDYKHDWLKEADIHTDDTKLLSDKLSSLKETRQHFVNVFLNLQFKSWIKAEKDKIYK
jgi:hypothetical protein